MVKIVESRGKERIIGGERCGGIKQQLSEQTAYVKALQWENLGTPEGMERRPAWLKARGQEKKL